MLHCSACLRSRMRAVFSRLCVIQYRLTSTPPHLLNRQAIRHSKWLRRGYAAEASVARDMPSNGPAMVRRVKYDIPNQPPDRPSPVETYKKRSDLRLELRWLKDPLKLADYTVNLLRQDDVQKALDIVRLASKDVECTVSWNHLIDYEMSKARVADALKLFNEMKKRAQQPDAYTFTILLRGFSWYPQFSQSTSRALAIYMSMFAKNSPVRPSIIHTNAVLKVCALAHDIDAMLGIAADLPTRGSGAPNQLTFTTILNAIRSQAFAESTGRKAPPGWENMDTNEITALAVRQGRRIWVEVRQRWMRGDLSLDEEFVCAMGRLLLLGREAHDHDDVLSLLEQTMGLPRQAARVADPALGGAEEPPESDDGSEHRPYSPADVELETTLSSPKEGDNFREPFGDPFALVPKAAGPSQSAVRPGRNTLSLVLDACIRLKNTRAAQDYWGILTSPDGHHKIIPDSDNYHMYLRLLRLQKSAKLAVELVEELRSGDLTGSAGVLQKKTFRIALSCCVRDSKNRNSIVHAGKLVKIMTDTLPYPDTKALGMYLQVAVRQEPRDWRVIRAAVRDTELGVRNLRSLLAYDPAGGLKENDEDVLELVKELIGAFDLVLNLGKEELDAKDKKDCKEQRNSLIAYLTRTHNRFVAEGKRAPTRTEGHRVRARSTHLLRKPGGEGVVTDRMTRRWEVTSLKRMKARKQKVEALTGEPAEGVGHGWRMRGEVPRRETGDWGRVEAPRRPE